MAKVIIYTAPSCPFCIRAKDLLKRRGVEFKEIHLGWDDDKAWDELTARTGMKTAPQILVVDSGKGAPVERLVGGFNELAELDQKDSLVSLK